MSYHFAPPLTGNLLALLCAAGLTAIGIASDKAPDAAIAGEPVVHEELIAELGADVPMPELTLISSPDGRQIAWREKRGSKWAVLLNSAVQGNGYDEVRGLFFSPDQRHLAYAARNGKDWMALVDGKKQGATYQKIAAMGFSPDSSRFAFKAKVDGGWRHVVDAAPGATYKELGDLAFSPDSRHFAYDGKKGNQWLVVTDGAEGPAFDDVGAPRYREDHPTPAYVARRGKAWMLVQDGGQVQLPEAKDGYRLAGFAPQTGEPILKVFDGDRSNLRVGNREGPLGDVRAPVVLDKAGEHFIYTTARIRTPAAAITERAYGQVVVDGTPGREYEGAPVESGGKAFFRAMGGEVLKMQRGDVPAFTALTHGVSSPAVRFEGGLHIADAARRGDKDFTVVVDGQEGPRMDAVPCGPAYAPNGDLYYAGVDAGKLVLVVNGHRVNETDLPAGEWTEKKDVCTDFQFGEGGHYVYSVGVRDSQRVFVDGQEHKKPSTQVTAGPIAKLATDGRFHYAYAAWPEPAKPRCYVVLDSFEGKVYNDVWPTTLRWTDDGTLTYLAREGRRLLKVTEIMP